MARKRIDFGLDGERDKHPSYLGRDIVLPDGNIIEIYNWAGNETGWNILFPHKESARATNDPLMVKFIVQDYINRHTSGGNNGTTETD